MSNEPSQRKTSLYWEAFRENWNTIPLTIGIGMAAACYGISHWSLILLLGTLFSEFVYLFLVPDTAWYKERCAKGKTDTSFGDGKEPPLKIPKILVLPRPPSVPLRPEMQQRYARLIALYAEIGKECSDDAQYAPVLESLPTLQKRYVERIEEEDKLMRYLQAEEKAVPPARFTTIVKRAGRTDENLARPIPIRPLRPPKPAYALAADPVEQMTEHMADRVIARLEDEALWLTRCANKVKSAELQLEVAAHAEKVRNEQDIMQKTEGRLKSIYNQLKNMEENTAFIRNNIQVRSAADLLKSLQEALAHSASSPGKSS